MFVDVRVCACVRTWLRASVCTCVYDSHTVTVCSCVRDCFSGLLDYLFFNHLPQQPLLPLTPLSATGCVLMSRWGLILDTS